MLAPLMALLVAFAPGPTAPAAGGQDSEDTAARTRIADAQAAGDRTAEARAWKDLALLQGQRDEHQGALAALAACIDAARAVLDVDLETRCLNNRGGSEEALGELADAEASYRAAVDAAHRGGLAANEAMALGNLARLERPRALLSSLEMLERAVTLAATTGDLQARTATLVFFAQALAEAGFFDPSIRRYEEALSLLRETSFCQGEATVLLALGLVLIQAERPRDAILRFEQTVATAERCHLEELKTAALAGLSAAKQLEARPAPPPVQPPQRVEVLRELFGQAQKLRNPQLEASLLAQIAEAELALGRLDDAIRDGEGALRDAEAAGVPEAADLALAVLDRAYELRRDFARRAPVLERLLAAARARDDRSGIALALRALSNAASDRGDPRHALELAEEGLAAAGNDPKEKALALELISALLTEAGEGRRAAEAAHAMITEAEQAGDHRQEARARYAYATALMMLGDLTAAERQMTLAAAGGRFANDPTLTGLAAVGLGTLSAARGDYAQAAAFWQRYLDGLDRTAQPPNVTTSDAERAIGLGLLARARTVLGEMKAAESAAGQAIELAERSGALLDRAIALETAGFVASRAGHEPEAEQRLRSAIAARTAARIAGERDPGLRIASLDQLSPAFELLISSLVRQGRTMSAFEAAEESRDRAFHEAIGDRQAGAGDQRSTPKFAEMAAYARDHDATLVEYALLYDPAQALAATRFEGLQETFEDRLLIWVVQPDGGLRFESVDLAARRRADGTTLGGSIRYFLTLVRAGQSTDDDSEREVLAELYRTLIAPIAAHLPAREAARVVFVPQGPLFLVPFAALRTPSGRAVAESWTVSTAPSIAAITAARPPRTGRPPANEILVVGGPRFAPELRLANLAHARDEAQAIAERFAAHPLLGTDATKRAVLDRIDPARWLHLATHGLLGTSEPGALPGAIVLAPEHGDLGLLEADEIRRRHLNADLAVLSACDSGLGRISGDGVFGLSRAFLLAGASGVVASLWQIDDAKTKDLMLDFYDRLAAGDDAPSALRAAQRAAIARGEPVARWAPFIFVGALAPR